MPPPPQPGAVPVDVCLPAHELVRAWRPDTRRLHLPSRAALRLQQRVVARIAIAGAGVSATVTGRVSSTRRDGAAHAFELAPDETRAKTVEWLVALARGEVVECQPRMPRLLAAVPAVVHGPVAPTYMTTFSVSERGCGLAWTGPAVPEVGAPVDVRLGAGSRAATFRSVVCWTERAGRTAMVGVRFVSGAQGAWSTMLAELARAGAPPA